MLPTRARSLSTSDKPKTRIAAMRHMRQLSGPIDGDLSATVSFAKLSIGSHDRNGVSAQQAHTPPQLSYPSLHGQLLPCPTSTALVHDDLGRLANDVTMADSNVPIAADPCAHSRRPLATMNSQSKTDPPPSSSTKAFMPIASLLQAPAPDDSPSFIDQSAVTEAEFTSVEEVADDTFPPAVSLDTPVAAHMNPDLDSKSHQHSILPGSSSSGLSSWDDAMHDETGPRLSSPLPPSSMPTSPATSIDPISPSKSHASPQPLSEGSPVARSPRSMSVDHSRASSPVKRTTSPSISPLRPSYRRQIASSPPPSSVLGKRTGSDDEHVLETMGGSSPVKRIRTDHTRSSSPPTATTRRQTATSQQRSRKKLIAPFRSPVMTRTTSPASTDQQLSEPSKPGSSQPVAIRPPPANATKTMTKLAMNSRAAAQFKSPMAARSAGGARPLILPTATIQALERKVTTLKRAIKIKRDGDEEKLAALAKKWREAGKEAAYELWDIVRDMAPSGSDSTGSGNDNWRSGWGWDGKDGEKESGDQDQKDDAMKVDEEEEKPEETLGVMLRKLGIDPDTLGWNDALESFAD